MPDDPTTPIIFPKTTPIDQPFQQPEQVTGYQADQAQQQAKAARDKNLTWGNLSYRLGSGDWGLDLFKDWVPGGPTFQADQSWQKPDISNPVFEGMGVNERVNLLADSHSEEELQYRMTQAAKNDQRAQMLADSAWYTHADSMIADGIKYTPLYFIPGVGEEVGLGKVGGFLVNLGKSTVEGAAAQAYLERNDPNRSASDLLSGAISNVVLGSVLHGAGVARAKLGQMLKEPQAVAPKAPESPPEASNAPPEPAPTTPTAETAAPPQEPPAQPQSVPEPQQAQPAFDPFNQSPQSHKDDWHDWYMLQRHLEIAKTNDAIDRGAVDPESLPQSSRDVLDAHREVEQMHDEVNDAEQLQDQLEAKVEEEYTKQHLEQMEAAGEIPPKSDPRSHLLEAFRDTGAARGEKVPLQDIMENLPMEADEKDVLASLSDMERAGEVKLHSPPALKKGALKEEAEEQPESYMVGSKDTSHVTFKKATTREEGKTNIARMRESSAKAETHADLAEALPDRSTAGLASEVKRATVRAQILRSRLQAEADFFAGKSSKVPERFQDDATPKDRADVQDMLKQRDVEEGRLPIPEKGDNVEPDQISESLEEHAPKPEYDLTSSEARRVVAKARAKLAEVRKRPNSPGKSKELQRLNGILESGLDALAQATRRENLAHGLLDFGPEVSAEDRESLQAGTDALRAKYTSKPGKTFGAHEMLDHQLQNLPEGQFRDLAGTLRGLVGNIKVSISKHARFDLETGKFSRKGAAGGYYPGTHSIVLGSLADAHVFLHELVHAVTSKFIRDNPGHPLVKELNDLLDRVRDEIPHADAYGLEDAHELLAEAMTRPSFQNDLRGIQVGAKTAWDHFVGILHGIINAARKAVGLSEIPSTATNALGEASRLFTQISKAQKVTGIDPRYTSRGEALTEAHASRALPDPNEYGTGERSFLWTKGGRLNPARTNAQRLTDERTLTPLMAGIGSKLVEPVVGAARGVTNRRTALGVKLRVMHSALQQIDRSGAYFTQYLAEQGMSTAQQAGFRIKNFLNHEADYAFQKDIHDWAATGRGQSQAAKKFNDEVVQPLLKQFRKDAQDAGVPGSEHWKDDYGLPRVYDHAAMDEVWTKLGGTLGGDDAMGKVFAAAYQKTGQAMGLSQNVIDTIGMGIWRRLRAAYGGYDAYTGHGINLGDVSFLEKTLRSSGLPGKQVEDALAELHDFRTERTGATEGHTKRRLDLDMSTPVNAPGVQAKTLADLLDKRAVDNLRHYSEGMGGQIGLSKMGFHTDADFNAQIEAGLADAQNQKNPQWATDQWENRMNAFYKAQMGQPLNDMESKEWSKIISAMATGFSASHLGVSGLPIWATNVTRNLGHGNALMTLKRFGEMASTRDYSIDPKTGEYQGAGVRAVMHLLGIQADPFSKRVFDHIHDGSRGLGDRVIDLAQTLANRAMQTVSSINPLGMTHAIRFGNKLSAMNAIQHMTDEMFGRSSNMGAGFKRWAGINEDMWNKAIAGFKAAIPDIDKKAFGSATQLNMGAFRDAAGDECMERIVAALRAQVGRRIHTADWGAATPFMENPLGRAVMQLRVFSFEAMAKQAGAGVNIGGREALSDATLMSLGGMAEFYIRSQINMAQMNDKERAKYVKDNMTMGKIIAAGVSRNPMTTMGSSLVDTLASPFGIGVFEGQRSSGLDNNLITGSPIYDGLNKTFAGFTDVAKSLEGQGKVTRRTLNNMNALNPLGNVLGVHKLLNTLGDTLNLPDKEPRKGRHAPPPESLTEAVFGNEPIQE